MKTIKLVTHWSTEQADDIYQLLGELQSAIWQGYGEDIVKMHQKTTQEQDNREERENVNDELLF